MYTQNKFLFCGITNIEQKQVPSKVYSVRCVGCVGCVEWEGVTVCTVTSVAKHQLTCSGGGVNMPLVREELNGRPVAMRLCAPPS